MKRYIIYIIFHEYKVLSSTLFLVLWLKSEYTGKQVSVSDNFY